MEFVLKYGAEVAILAFAVILIVGVLKTVFKAKLSEIAEKNATAVKAIYEVLAFVGVAVVTILWLLIATFLLKQGTLTWEGYLSKAGAVYVAVKVMYPIYENYGIRDLVKTLIPTLVEVFSKGKIPAKTDEDSQVNN